MYGTKLTEVQCPYCGEPIEIVVDSSVLSQEYIEDCQVCCRPITMRVAIEGEALSVEALHENEY